MTLHIIPSGPIQTIGYLLTSPERGEAVLIDAPDQIWEKVEPILAREKCRLVELWITHGHWDHTQGGAEIVKATGAKVRAHPADKPMIETPEIMKPYMIPGMTILPIVVDFWVKQGDLFTGMERKLPVCFARVDVAKYFGGMITPGWLANLDCAGKGPKSFKCGKKVVYTTTDFVAWLRSMNDGGAA